MLFEKTILSKYLYITVESKYNKKILQKYTKSNIFVIPSGVDLNVINEIKNKYKINNKDIDILYVGRLSNEKGVDILIKSIKKLINEYNKNIKIYVCGDGPQKNELINLTKKLNLDKNIKFLGYVPDEKKYECYLRTKILIIPSRWDFSPITIIEAIAFGVPVIVSNKTNTDLIIDKYTGLIFESNNINNLAEKILYILEDTRLQTKIKNKYNKIIKKYDWSIIIKKYINLYNHIVDHEL